MGRFGRRTALGCRAQLFLLPPDSPDMNPINYKMAFAQDAARQAPERTVGGLWRPAKSLGLGSSIHLVEVGCESRRLRLVCHRLR